MKAYLHWIVLGVLAVILALTTIQAVGQYSAKNTIRGVSKTTYTQAISDILSPTNPSFSSSNIVINKVTYSNDSLAVVKVTGKNSGLNTYVVFELKDNKLYLTNYGPNLSITDFDSNSDTTNHIINSANNT